ncbi:MAG TPA: DUF262 domain-containing HNH endonuclease family protein [Coleofasciculaceae cyanobacterium]|jgi:uncharacterized protein with ParB-like and HNH nuclease domain
MSEVRIEGKEFAIGKIFSDDFEFTIPGYQRPYSWDTEKAEALLNDLLGALGDENKKIEDIEPYFLGCIVLIKGKSRDAEVVDGQQRLTTLTILLAALRASIPNKIAEDIVKLIYQKGNLLYGTYDRYRLKLRERDEDFFKTYIQNEDGIERLKTLSDAELSDSQKLIKANALLFLNRLQGTQGESEVLFSYISKHFNEYSLESYSLDYSNNIPEPQRLRLAQFIIQRCFLVVVSTPNLETAYRIFSILNDRGFNISLTDILKAEIIGNIDKEQQGKYTKKWEDAEEKLGRKNFQELFSHIRTIRRKVKPNRNLLDELREYAIKPDNSSQYFIDNTLCRYANAFYKIQKPNDEANKLLDQLKYIFRLLNKITHFDWLPPAIAYLGIPNLDESSLVRFFTDLERLAAGLMILGTNANVRFKRYSQLLELIEKQQLAKLFELNSPLQLTSLEQNRIIKILNGDLYLMNKFSRYILLRLDTELSGSGASYNHDIITIEHVLPQSPPPGSNWEKLFPSKEEREKKYLHCLGNLVLLARSKNSQAQNFEFEYKKQVYFTGSNGISPFVLTTQVLMEQEWNPNVIENRQIKLMNVLKNTWRLQGDSGERLQGDLGLAQLSLFDSFDIELE